MRDDLALLQQTLNARVDQSGAERRQIIDADGQREKPGDVEDDDAPRQARRALIDEELPGVARPVEKAADAAMADGRSRFAEAFGLDLRFDRSQRRGPVVRNICGSIEHVVCRGSDRPSPFCPRKRPEGSGQTP